MRLTSNQETVGSSPTQGAIFTSDICKNNNKKSEKNKLKGMCICIYNKNEILV